MSRPTHKAIVSKLTKAGFTVQSHYSASERSGITRYWADNSTDRISWAVINGEETISNALYVRPLNMQDDPITDYSAGMYANSIGQAIRLASR